MYANVIEYVLISLPVGQLSALLAFWRTQWCNNGARDLSELMEVGCSYGYANDVRLHT